MNYAIEEAVVDAFVAYLKTKVASGATVRAAPSAEALQYPCVVIRVASVRPIAAGVSWADMCKCSVEIGILSEMADEIDETGVVIKQARMRHAEVRASVMNALTIKDNATAPEGLTALASAEDLPAGLAAWLTFQQIPGVWIQSAKPSLDPLATMDVDEEHRCLVTKIQVGVIAQAVELPT